MNRILATAFLVCVTAAATSVLPTVAADPQESEGSAITPLMRMKLDNSKMILEGLTTDDFEKIAKGARALKLLSMESGWNVIQTATYTAQSDDFRRSTDLVASAAENKDISRATLGYVGLTVRCVECHSYMRSYRGAK